MILNSLNSLRVLSELTPAAHIELERRVAELRDYLPAHLGEGSQRDDLLNVVAASFVLPELILKRDGHLVHVFAAPISDEELAHFVWRADIVSPDGEHRGRLAERGSLPEVILDVSMTNLDERQAKLSVRASGEYMRIRREVT